MSATQARSNQEWLHCLGKVPPSETVVGDLVKTLRGGLARGLANRGDVSGADIEDFAQEASTRVLSSLQSFRAESRFTTWATSVAIRVALTKMRRRSWGEQSLDDLAPVDSLPASSSAADTADNLAKNQLLKALHEAIESTLTPKQQKVVMAELSGMPTDAIAEQLGTNTNAVYKVHHDARKKLRAAIEQSGFSAPDIRTLLAPKPKDHSGLPSIGQEALR